PRSPRRVRWYWSQAAASMVLNLVRARGYGGGQSRGTKGKRAMIEDAQYEQQADDQGRYVEPGQAFDRDTNYIADRITADGQGGWPVEAGRYRLVAARACPWANRTLIVRRLLGLED